MKSLKSVLAVLVTVLALAGFNTNLLAEEAKKSTEGINIEQVKTNIISSIDERIKLLQDEKACVSAARTREDLKKCREASREERKKVREEMKEKRKSMRQQGSKQN